MKTNNLLRTSLCVLFFVFCNVELVFTQNSLRKLTVEEDGFRCVLSVMNPGVQRKVNPPVYYYWYQGGRVFCNQGYFSGCLLHGKYEKFDGAGHLVISGWFDRGVKTGRWLSWNEEGKLVKEEAWREGARNGWTVIREEDQTIKIPYRNDRIEGCKEIVGADGKAVKEYYRHDVKVMPKLPRKAKTIKVMKPDSLKTGDSISHRSFFKKIFSRHSQTVTVKKG